MQTFSSGVFAVRIGDRSEVVPAWVEELVDPMEQIVLQFHWFVPAALGVTQRYMWRSDHFLRFSRIGEEPFVEWIAPVDDGWRLAVGKVWSDLDPDDADLLEESGVTVGLGAATLMRVVSDEFTLELLDPDSIKSFEDMLSDGEGLKEVIGERGLDDLVWLSNTPWRESGFHQGNRNTER